MSGLDIPLELYLKECQYRMIRHLPGITYQDIELMDTEDFFFHYHRLRADLGLKKVGPKTPEGRKGTPMRITPEGE